ncbi:MAG: TatD family hydrolase [Bacteroidaceae bacterium]|nr:TatD family hydrolase [Bacteroidaceae bacterium]
MITDTHSHLYGEEFAADIDDVVQRARAAGVSRIFLPGINADSIEPMLSLCRRYPGFFFPMIGLHPEELGTTWREVLPRMEELLAQPDHPFLAVGEVGLDYYWDRSLYEEQQEAFALQVGWAIRYDLPLMLHVRKAHREMVNILRTCINGKSSDGQLQGVFHCFSGSAEEARELMHFEGFMFGIGGIVTFKNAHLPQVLRENIPLERIVLETDAPYMAPVPYRGKRNESAYLTAVIDKLAEVYDTTPAKIADQTTINALKTFPKCR